MRNLSDLEENFQISKKSENQKMVNKMKKWQEV